MTIPSDRDYALGPLLRRAQRRAADAFNVALAPMDIQGRHFGILMTLNRIGPITQQELIRRLGSDKSEMVRMIDDLENLSIVERRRHPSDRRAFAVTLTAHGRDVFNSAERTARNVADELLDGFTSAERKQFMDFLSRFVRVASSGPSPLPGPSQLPPSR